MLKRLALVGAMLLVLEGGLVLTEIPVLAESRPAAEKTNSGTAVAQRTNRRRRRTQRRRRRRGRRR
jgi:hypothetical protein